MALRLQTVVIICSQSRLKCLWEASSKTSFWYNYKTRFIWNSENFNWTPTFAVIIILLTISQRDRCKGNYLQARFSRAKYWQIWFINDRQTYITKHHTTWDIPTQTGHLLREPGLFPCLSQVTVTYVVCWLDRVRLRETRHRTNKFRIIKSRPFNNVCCRHLSIISNDFFVELFLIDNSLKASLDEKFFVSSCKQ